MYTYKHKVYTMLQRRECYLVGVRFVRKWISNRDNAILKS